MQDARDDEAFSPPNPCSPVDPNVLDAILSRLETPIESIPGFVGIASSSGSILSDLQKKCKSSLASNQMTRKSMGGTVFQGTGVLASPFKVQIGGEPFEIRASSARVGTARYSSVTTLIL